MVRALPGIGPGGTPAPGWITLVVMPHSHDAQPQPSFELRRQVHAFVAARRPATLAGQIQVTGPSYFPVGVEAVLVPLPAAEPGPVLAAVLAASDRAEEALALARAIVDLRLANTRRWPAWRHSL